MKFFSKLAISLLLSVNLVFGASAYSSAQIPEPPQSVFVGDYANVLSESTEQHIIRNGGALDNLTGAQIVVVTVDFTGGADIEDYAYEIFNTWGIGNAERDNGLLLLLVIGEENYWALQGSGIENSLTSGLLGDYLYEYLEPVLRRGITTPV